MNNIKFRIVCQPSNIEHFDGLSDKAIEEMKHDIEEWLGPQRIQDGLIAVVEPKGEGLASISIESLGLKGEFPLDETGRQYTNDIVGVLLNHYKFHNNGIGEFVSKSDIESRNLFGSLFEFELLDETK